ncbi:28760_t:CDS:2 [Dentiscutata erythropus]|uniref:28760_t:CDS:1 n=1 Tax=Dentiscutata erythropus TaxID=1348616 RepID=A0A9N9NDU9_9GLOM|nr:28760_t:CDS:2 [Dentiscutata erythropus]
MSTNVSSDLTSAPPRNEYEPPPKKLKCFFLDFSYIFSKEFLIIFLLGQFLAICITATIVSNAQLSIENVNIPTTQSLFLYFTLAIIYTPITIYKYGIMGYIKMLKSRWWKYLLLGLVDVEGNYFAVKGYFYTSALSMTLLDAWATPVVVLLSVIFFKMRYHISQYFGVIICLAGLGIVILADLEIGTPINATTSGAPPPNAPLGDAFAVIGATFYGISNVYEEYCVRKRPLYEVVGQMGVWAIFERTELQNLGSASGSLSLIVGLIIAYNVAMIFLYTLTPVLLRLSSALFFNISLLASDFYALALFYLVNLGPMSKIWGPVEFCLVVVGLIIYNINPASKPEITPDYIDYANENENERDLESSYDEKRVNNVVVEEL